MHPECGNNGKKGLDVLRQMKRFFYVFGILFSVLLYGCVTLSSSKVTVQILEKGDKGAKVVTFLDDTPYIADMSVALSEHGFKIKPMPTQQQINELKSNKLAKYDEPVTRWGISIQTQYWGQCYLTDYAIFNFTLTLTDITNNKIVMVLKQKGSDGPCTTVEPAFGTLAKALSDNW
jgi:hypothetical protein